MSNAPEISQLAPDFTAPVQYPQTLEKVNLYQLLSQNKGVLLVFYPGDDTPGCTKQLCGLRDLYQKYIDAGIAILGINPGSRESHLKFIQKYNYQFGIVVDENKSIREKYGAIKNIFGKQTTKRGVFLIHSSGDIVYRIWGQQDNQKVLTKWREYQDG